MKHLLFVVTLLAAVSLAACSQQASTSAQQTASSTTVVSTTAPLVPTTTPTQTTAGDTVEEAEIRELVENFGKRFQLVSLLAPTAAQEIQEQYSEFVSPTLLEQWGKDGSKAPGRIVSSPWPDRIEITTLSKEDSNRYAIRGFVVGVTSAEVVSGGAAARNPVRMVVQREQGRWLITEYAEER